jgi:endonuclease/exonuclease/phosphatase family metal-dependent hydrolase
MVKCCNLRVFKNLTQAMTLLFMLAGSAVSARAASSDVVLYAGQAPVRAGAWNVVSDTTAAGGSRISNPDLGAAKLTAALAQPANYFEMTFPAVGGQPYHLWIRAKAAGDSSSNDSIFVQFSDSVASDGTAINRIGTTSATAMVLQDCFGDPLQSWGWTDNGWCGPGQNVIFQTTGTHTIRVQVREDGMSIDQVVLSPVTYLSASPGARVNDTTILAANLPAVGQPSATLSASPSSGSVPLAVTFNLKLTLPNGPVATYLWNFGDGQSSTQALPVHTYQAGGNYTAKVTVTDVSGATASASAVIAVTSAGGSITLKVVEANISYGGHGTDNVINLDRLTNWLVKMNPDAASLIEVLGGSKDPANITALMQQKTGIPWYNYYVPKYAGCNEGVMILSKWPFLSTSYYFMSYQMPIAQATLNVNGKAVNFFSTHFQWPSTASAERQVEANELVAFARNFAEPRILAGDFNAQTSTPEVQTIMQSYLDSWGTAVGAGKATAYPDNPASLSTRTRRTRIDFVFHSKSATTVSVKAGQVPDTRDLTQKPVVLLNTLDDRGVRPSDHNFMSVTFTVN